MASQPTLGRIFLKRVSLSCMLALSKFSYKYPDTCDLTIHQRADSSPRPLKEIVFEHFYGGSRLRTVFRSGSVTTTRIIRVFLLLVISIFCVKKNCRKFLLFVRFLAPWFQTKSTNPMQYRYLIFFCTVRELIRLLTRSVVKSFQSKSTSLY